LTTRNLKAETSRLIKPFRKKPKGKADHPGKIGISDKKRF